MRADLPDWIVDPALAPLWDAARERLERDGLVAAGRVTLRDLDRPARHAVGGLLGRSLLRDRIQVDLAALDADLAARSGVGGLVAVLTALSGPLADRPAVREQTAVRREAPYATALAWLEGHQRQEWPWAQEWLAGVRRSGLLTRSEDPVALLTTALEVLADVLSDGSADGPPRSRAEVAAAHTGDAHALDSGTAVGALVQRGLALAAGQRAAVGAGARRALWERHGVVTDAVSSTCLTLGLRPSGDGPLARRLVMAADAGDPVHVTAWDLRHGLDVPAGTSVLVCENPRVLEAVAQRYAGAVAVVCGAGQPRLVVLAVLRALAGSGARLAYHGDFDWAGVSIAARVAREVGAPPWRMSAADYRRAARPGGLPLSGRPVETPWDPGLADAMREVGVAVHEESVLDDLLAGLDRRRRDPGLPSNRLADRPAP